MFAASAAEEKPLGAKLGEAFDKAARGGIAGGGAMAINVAALMWMRTTVNYQYRHGGSMTHAFKVLYNDGGRGLGGIARFYRGVVPALFQGPLARFGDTFSNVGTLAILDSFGSTASLPTSVKTMAASVAAASFRILLMPIDACKTIMQVEGKNGMSVLLQKIKTSGPTVLWSGALGASGATLVGHYPWFATYNELDARLPKYDRKTELPMYLARSAVIGFGATCVSDTCSNAIRVLKTTKQTSAVAISYKQALDMVIAKDGVSGLFFRGLSTKILSNGVQGMLFSVLWRLGQDWMAARAAKKDN